MCYAFTSPLNSCTGVTLRFTSHEFKNQPGLWNSSCKVFLIVSSRLDRWLQLRIKDQTTLTTFILVELIDDIRVKILLFISLFLSYMLNVLASTHHHLTLIDFHLKTPVYLFLQNFSLDISFTTACIPRFRHSISSGDKSDTWLIEYMAVLCAVLTFIITLMCVDLSYIITSGIL